MSKHRQPKRRAGSRRAETKPRYGRMAAAGSAVVLTGTAVLGGIGLFPDDVKTAPTDMAAAEPNPKPKDEPTASTEVTEEPTEEPAAPPSTELSPLDDDDRPEGGTPARNAKRTPLLPDESGEGRRVVYSESEQRVWLVKDDEKVNRSYSVSGSIYDNLEPGTYEVYSRSEEAVGIDNSGTMRYFVRFTEGDNGAAIGFHDIPELDGVPLQSVDELGTPTSHGCVRQKRSDAIALWEFADIGTTVVVTA
ncbi:L,D-transpeptidase [Nocardioides speluncae]|uniref:L,D-transpeptidase n=1 Tax=Nocardioides speluncae TaxID=2670337 RepID=UPI000D68CA1A|nr:L,D-transpeptidase [Nocardioides speluncae]